MTRPDLSDYLRGRLWVPKAYVAAHLVGHRDLRRLVVVTEGRAGSEALVTRLDSHPDILCDSEILATRRMRPEDVVEGRARLARVRGRRAYGFKVLTRHILSVQDVPEATDYLRRLEGAGWLVIHLRRRNRLQQAISALRAQRTQYHFEVGHLPPFEPMRVEPAELLAVLELYTAAEGEATRLLGGMHPLKLVYEDDLASSDAQERTVARIVEALGLQAAPTSTRQARVSPRSVRDMVTNYEELVELLAHTPFACHLDLPVGPTEPDVPANPRAG
ncbi:MAG: hypothetical protein ACR2MN_04295 [Acidimicrobiales bacterium]